MILDELFTTDNKIIDTIKIKIKEIILVNSIYLLGVIFGINYTDNNGFLLDAESLIIYLLAVIIFMIINSWMIKKLINTLKNDIIRIERINSRMDIEFLDNKVNHILSKNLSHELKTPLAAISSANYQLKSLNDQTPENVKIFNIIDNCLYMMSVTLETLKKFGNNDYDEDLYAVIEKSVDVYSIQTEYSLDFLIDPEFKGKVSGINPNILSNILINHIKNSHEAKATLIKFEYSVLKNFKYINIIDNGKGIPLSDQKQIYNSNFSNKSSHTNQRGIGLYICKHIMNKIKGDDLLYYSDSYGSIFQIKIPIIQQLHT